MFDEGRLSDSHGRVADFRNTVIIMTSNLGQQELREMRISNEKQEMLNNVEESLSTHTGGGGSGSGSASAARVGEDEVDEALALHDATYSTLKNNIMTDDENNNNLIENDNKEKSRAKSEEKINDMTLELVNKYFSLEFVNRIDEVIMFNPLSIESVQSICRVQISKVKNLLTARGNLG